MSAVVELSMSEIIDILNNCEDCIPSQCCQACDDPCDEHQEILTRLYELYDADEVDEE